VSEKKEDHSCERADINKAGFVLGNMYQWTPKGNYGDHCTTNLVYKTRSTLVKEILE